MFRQVHRRLTLLCAGITILVLLLMSCSYLYISEKNLRESSFTSFQNDMNTLLSNLENQTVITHEWLSKMEGNGKYLLSLRDNGQDFLWGRQEHDPACREAIDAGWNYYDANSGGFPSAQPFTIRHQEFSFSSSGGKNDDYYGCIAFSSRDTGTLTILILQSMGNLQERILTQRNSFLILIVSASLILAFFSYLFTGLLLKPLKKSRQSQIEFVAAASHELRTPLSVILSASNACRKAPPEEQGMFFDIIKKEGDAMSGLISDLLTLAGADSHSFTIRAASCEPDTLLLDTFEAFELLAREKGYHLSIQLPEEKTTPVFCDSDRIRQVLSVLLHNAFSFCPSGSRITLSLSQQDKITSISVADNGPGIPDDRKAHLFDRFYRGDSSRQDTGHFGLGLSIAREIMDAHHGSLTVSDTPGGGSTFTLILNNYRKKP